ncbi:MAG TPA: imidazole glycerol phosphate synthase subunit HisH [Saprospiraceae bacterium]|mgnify:FL=1|nr:imidazole glycerol phosphate synthase subunit HisH [Saprospiraceae bacterium]
MTAVLKYNAGNVQSVLFALERLGVQAVWTDDPDTLRAADKVIFPGQGEASSAMQYLRERGLDEVIRSLQQPVLGICIGLQLFCRHSEENDTDCLGIFDADVRKFSGMGGLKVPQMGWNQLVSLQGPLFVGVPEENFVYFVHSYYAEEHPAATAITEYGERFSAAMQRDNFHAVQFHPEKSGPTGQRILQNFLNL